MVKLSVLCYLLLILVFHECGSEMLRYRGRYYTENDSTKFLWSSTGVACRVRNTTTVSVRFKLPRNGIRLQVRVNDDIVSTMTVRNKEKIVLVRDLDPESSNLVEVIRVMEPSVSDALTFHEFVLDDHGVFLSTPRFSERRLEFIGDSDTAGFCVDGRPSGSDSDQPKIEDSTESWAGQIAMSLNVSDVQIEAVSGWGVTEHSTPIQSLLPYADGLNAKHRWDTSVKWIPHGILILIGPNDYDDPDDVPTDKTFIEKYKQILEYAEERYGSVSISRGVAPPVAIHVCGGSGNGLLPCPNILRASNEWNKNASRIVRSSYVSVTEATWNAINQGTEKYNGCDGHYSRDGHRRLVSDVVKGVRKALGW